MKWCSTALIIREMQIKTTHTGKNESESESLSVVSDSLRPHGLYSPWNSLGQNTGVGSLPGISRDLPKPGIKIGLLHCRRILYQLSHKGSPRILKCYVAYPFSSGSSWPRKWTGVSCIEGGFFSLPTELSGKPQVKMVIIKIIYKQ